MRRKVVYDVCVARDAGGQQRGHAVAVLLHGRSKLQQHPHDLKTARLRAVVKRRVACEQCTIYGDEHAMLNDLHIMMPEEKVLYGGVVHVISEEIQDIGSIFISSQQIMQHIINYKMCKTAISVAESKQSHSGKIEFKHLMS